MLMRCVICVLAIVTVKAGMCDIQSLPSTYALVTSSALLGSNFTVVHPRLPAGQYSLQNVGGCMKYSTTATHGWTVNAFVDANKKGWWFSYAFGVQLLFAPGSYGLLNDCAGYTSGTLGRGCSFPVYADCDAYNKQLPPLYFNWTYDLQPLGFWLNDAPYSNNLPGATVPNGTNPSWALAGESYETCTVLQISTTATATPSPSLTV